MAYVIWTPLLLHHFSCRFVLLKVAQAGGQTWDLLIIVYFLSQLHGLRPLGYCVPLSWRFIYVVRPMYL